MKETPTARSSKRSEQPTRGRADLSRLRRTGEKEIRETSPPELVELPVTFWEETRIVEPVPKEPVSIRLDADVLAWFRDQGPRYQSRMNAVLRAYMTASRGRRPRKAS